MDQISQPSIFELFAQQQLKNEIREGFKYLIKIFVEQTSFLPSNLFYKFDEFYLILELFIEYFHLKTYSCSYSEFFYRLKRINKDGSKLSKKQILISLTFLSILPYLKQKLLSIYINQKELNYRTITEKTSKQKLLNTIMVLYPKMITFIDTINFVYKILYTSNQTKLHSLDLLYSNLILTYQDPNIKNSGLTNFLLSIFNFGINSGAFYIQFLDNWFTQNKTTSFLNMPEIKPPVSSDQYISNNKTLCQICNKPKMNPTVVSTTGYVFCFDCIYNYVKLFKRCPITYYPVDLDNLVKLN